MRGILGYFSWQTSARCIPVTVPSLRDSLWKDEHNEKGRKTVNLMRSVKFIHVVSKRGSALFWDTDLSRPEAEQNAVYSVPVITIITGIISSL